MSIPNYLYALANHKGPATVNAGGLSIPVKLMDIEHKSSWMEEECTFKCMVVNPEQILTHDVTRSTRGTDYVQQALAKATSKRKVIDPIDPMKIDRVIFNDPATIVLWADGTKTVVKCQEGDIYSKETGLALCIAKKALGNKSNFNDIFHKWIPEEEPEVLPVGIEDAFGEALRRMAAATTRAMLEANYGK